MKTQHLFLIAIFSLSFFLSCTKEDEKIENTITTYKLRVKGNIKSCNNSNLSNGYLLINCNNEFYSIYINNGFIDTTFQSNYPFDSLIAYSIDLDALKTSDTTIAALKSDFINLGIINTCARDADEYINFKINDEKHVFIPVYYDSLYVNASDTLNASTTYMYRMDYGNILYNSKYRRTQFNGITTGTFAPHWNSSVHIGRFYAYNMPTSGTITYTTYGEVGSYITGTVNLPFTDNVDKLNYTVTGSFKVRRDY